MHCFGWSFLVADACLSNRIGDLGMGAKFESSHRYDAHGKGCFGVDDPMSRPTTSSEMQRAKNKT